MHEFIEPCCCVIQIWVISSLAGRGGSHSSSGIASRHGSHTKYASFLALSLAEVFETPATNSQSSSVSFRALPPCALSHSLASSRTIADLRSTMRYRGCSSTRWKMSGPKYERTSVVYGGGWLWAPINRSISPPTRRQL